MTEPKTLEKNKPLSYGISWLIAGIILLLMGLITLGGGYGLTFLSIPLLITSLVVGSRTIKSISAIVLLLALGSTWSLYNSEKDLRQESMKIDGG